MSGKDGWADILGGESEATEPSLPTIDAPAHSSDAEPWIPSEPGPTHGLAAQPEPVEPAPLAVDPPAFSVDTLVSKIDATTSPGDEDAAQTAGLWSEWREVIVVGTLGLFALVAAFAWSGSAPPEASVQHAAPPPQPTPSAAPEADRQPQRDVDEAEQPERSTPSSAPPVLSVVTQPPGALISIDGVVYGRSPLIMPAPSDVARLDITLMLDGHRKQRLDVRRSRAGHFNVNATLKPM